MLHSRRSLLVRPLRALLGRRLFSKLRLLDQGDTASSSSMDSNSTVQSYRYDVFISFRGADTRNNFVDHLYAHLIRKGIFAFKDDTRLEKGDSISVQLLQAIKDSRVSIIVFSKDYAASTWCLDEMTSIFECHSNKGLKRTVFPVFYDVDPSHVRKQNGVYENAFVLHSEQFKKSKIDRWKRAMTSLAGLGGWDMRDKPQVQQIESIVQKVIQTLGHKFSRIANDDLIGIQPHVETLESLLKLKAGDDNVRVLGIWGMDGIGKTTLATVLYDRISYQFDACCFIENLSKIYRDGGGVVAVQKQILCQTIKEKNLETYSPSELSGIIRNRLHNIKKLLVVLDNVDQCEQLQELALDPKLLHPESRIIITTRDKHILIEYGANIILYEAQLMNDADASKFLCRKAFQNDYPEIEFEALVPEVIEYAHGLPLAIKVLGSLLYDRDVIQWRATLKRLENNPNNKIMETLRIGYDDLELNDKDIFLHIACFFTGEREDYVRRILDCCGLHPEIGIPSIIDKSLITIRNQEIHMHEMLQELGKQIVREQHPDEPDFWSRLWLYRDFHQVMMTERKAMKVKAIVLDQKEDGFKCNKLRAEDLSKMSHLTLLILSQINFSGRLISLSNWLRYLSWNGYPFTILPSTFEPYPLVELNIPNSNIQHLWEGIKELPYLKRMDLSNSKNLEKTPSFERIPNLVRLDFTGCINLWQVHPSIGLLTKLEFLSLQNCSSLISLDFGSSGLSSLKVLHLSGCTKLKNTPDFTGASKLEYLDMDRCESLLTIHESIGALQKLRFISLRHCTSIVELMPGHCTNLINVVFLDLSFCNISQVPDAIGELRCLERLNLQGNNFTELPVTISLLHRLAYLNLSHCHLLQRMPRLPSPYLDVSSTVGRYFRITSGSRDHRSGLYFFNCPKLKIPGYLINSIYETEKWLGRLMKEPRHFRCGFDIVTPLDWEKVGSKKKRVIPRWCVHRFEVGSIIRATHANRHVDWVGFIFCVAFEVNNSPAMSGNSPHPFYLSFENEYTEARFDMPLNLDLDKTNGSTYLWTIYISREHCHFVETGAQITFKARQGLVIKEWGLHMLTKEDKEYIAKKFYKFKFPSRLDNLLVIDYVKESSSNNNFGTKIQLPYNWLISKEEEDENNEAKEKEINLYNQGLSTSISK